MDVFYLAQLAAAVYRHYNHFSTEDDVPGEMDFAIIYAAHHDLLGEDVWKDYYTPAFLVEASSALFYRLPNLQDLPDASDPLGHPRSKGSGHFTKLPRWADTVARVARRKSPLSVQQISEIALATLEQTILRQREMDDRIQTYSATQARFWLDHMGLCSPNTLKSNELRVSSFGIAIAQGTYDILAWEAHYSLERWYSGEARVSFLPPDLDGTRKSEVIWCGWPDGGVGASAEMRGWEPELGSEEEVVFLAAVAMREIEDVDFGGLDFSLQSHRLFGVLCAALDVEPEKGVAELKEKMVQTGCVDDVDMEQWTEGALAIMKPYIKQNKGANTSTPGRAALMKQILKGDGQLFLGWKLFSTSREVKIGSVPKTVAFAGTTILGFRFEGP